MEALFSASSLSKKNKQPQTESIKTFGKNGNQQTQKKGIEWSLKEKEDSFIVFTR